MLLKTSYPMRLILALQPPEDRLTPFRVHVFDFNVIRRATPDNFTYCFSCVVGFLSNICSYLLILNLYIMAA